MRVSRSPLGTRGPYQRGPAARPCPSRNAGGTQRWAGPSEKAWVGSRQGLGLRPHLSMLPLGQRVLRTGHPRPVGPSSDLRTPPVALLPGPELCRRKQSGQTRTPASRGLSVSPSWGFPL